MKPSRYKGFLAVLERTQQELAEGRISIDAAKLRILAEIAGAVCKIADEEQEAIFTDYGNLLNSFGAEVKAEIGKPKAQYKSFAVPEDLKNFIAEIATDKYKAAVQVQ